MPDFREHPNEAKVAEHAADSPTKGILWVVGQSTIEKTPQVRMALPWLLGALQGFSGSLWARPGIVTYA